MKKDTIQSPVYKLHSVKKAVHVKSFISAFDSIRDSAYIFKEEMHNFWEFVYVMHGKIGSTADDQVYEISSGHAVFHKPMEFHSHWAEGGISPHILIIAFEAYGSAMPEFEDKIFQIDEQREKMLLEIVSIAGKHLASETESEDKRIQLNFAGICLERFLLSLLMKPTITKARQTPGLVNYRLIIEVLNAHINENLSLDAIAQMCSMSKANLKKTFHKYSGTGVISYFNTMKMKKAAQLLKDGVSISEISETLSFSCQNYFSTMFKRIMGCSPRAYLNAFDHNYESVPKKP